MRFGIQSVRLAPVAHRPAGFAILIDAALGSKIRGAPWVHGGPDHPLSTSAALRVTFTPGDPELLLPRFACRQIVKDPAAV